MSREHGLPPEEMGENRRYSIGRIEQIKDPQIEEQLRKLDAVMDQDPVLQAKVQALRNRFLTREGFFQMIESWNRDHKSWVGAYVERSFRGAHGEVLQIRLDRSGNIRLAGRYTEGAPRDEG